MVFSEISIGISVHNEHCKNDGAKTNLWKSLVFDLKCLYKYPYFHIFTISPKNQFTISVMRNIPWLSFQNFLRKSQYMKQLNNSAHRVKVGGWPQIGSLGTHSLIIIERLWRNSKSIKYGIRSLGAKLKCLNFKFGQHSTNSRKFVVKMYYKL